MSRKRASATNEHEYSRMIEAQKIHNPQSAILDPRSLRCPVCQGVLISAQSLEVVLGCLRCNETFPVVDGIPRMISSAMRQAIGGENPLAGLTQIDRMRVVQADIHHLPFEPESFDLVYSIGVLHHLPDPEPAFRNLLRYIKPGGWIHIYLYWRPENQPVNSNGK